MESYMSFRSNIAICIDVPESFRQEVVYTFENLFFPYKDEFTVFDKWEDCKNYKDVIIYCHESSPLLNENNKYDNCLYIILENSTLKFYSCHSIYDISNVLFVKKIPCLFPLKKQISISSSCRLLPFDLFAASFFFLSCWQEYAIKERDGKGRIQLKSAIQQKLGIIRTPIVNEYLKLFENYARSLWGKQLEYKKMPGNSNLFITLSHDVDHVDWTFSKYVKSLRANRREIDKSFSCFIDIAKNCCFKKDIFYKLKEIEIEYGVLSTNYFLSDYNTEHKEFVSSFIRSLEDSGFEVGHHISDKSIFEGLLKEDRARFRNYEKKIYGERVHTLRYEVNDLFSQLENSDYCYDSSLLFAEDMGYRTGFTYPHYVYNPNEKKTFKIMTIPLNLMDTTLVEGKYLGLSDDKAFSELYSYFNRIIAYGGVFSVLFHHSFFWINSRSRLKNYENLLKYFMKSGAKIGACRDIYFWHKEQTSI